MSNQLPRKAIIAVSSFNGAISCFSGLFAGVAQARGVPVGRLEDHFWIRDRKARLSYYIDRGGSGLSVTQRQTLEAAKGELRKLFGKDKTTRTA